MNNNNDDNDDIDDIDDNDDNDVNDLMILMIMMIRYGVDEDNDMNLDKWSSIIIGPQDVLLL